MPRPRLADAALAGAGALWGASFPLGKVALDYVGPAWLVVFRFALAAAVLLPMIKWRALQLEARDWMHLVASSFVLGPAMFLVQFEGLARTTSSSAALLVATAPPMMALAGGWIDRETPSRRTWLGIGLSSLGIILLAGFPGPGRTVVGDALVFVSMIAAVAWTFYTRRIARRLGALPATGIQFALGALWLLPFAFAREAAPLTMPAFGWLIVGVLGVACTAASFFLWNWALQRTEAARAGVFGNIEPVVGAALGVTLLGEVLGPTAIVGGIVVVTAALLVTMEPAPAQQTEPA
jgi:drug/metabolite transporter (DMT)-like permease